MINNSRKSLWIQIICISIFIIAPFLLIPQHHSDGPSVVGINFMIFKNLVSHTLLVLFFYFSYYILIPIFYQKKYQQFILYFLISALITLAPPLLIEKSIEKPQRHINRVNKHLFSNNHDRPQFEPHDRAGRPGGPKKHGVRHLEDDLFLFVSVFIISIALNLQARIKQSEKEKLLHL